MLSLDRSIEEAKVSQETRVGRLILVPALITLGVTLLRLVGELANWSPRFFSRDAGGGAAVVGIAWLVPFFGAWFGWQLARAGSRPSSYGRAVGLTLLGFALIPAAGFGASAMGIPQASLTTLWIFVVAALLGIFVAMQAWPALGRTLLAYGLAARIPVVIVMLVDRVNIASGTTTMHALDGRLLGSFTLAAPCDAALVDDSRVMHGVTAVHPVDPSRPAWRDVLVVTYRAQPPAAP